MLLPHTFSYYVGVEKANPSPLKQPVKFERISPKSYLCMLTCELSFPLWECCCTQALAHQRVRKLETRKCDTSKVENALQTPHVPMAAWGSFKLMTKIRNWNMIKMANNPPFLC